MTKGRVETIDVFRGIAIVLVILFHFTARLPASALNITQGAPWPVSFGWTGVYFFFIISGYCIFITLEKSASVGVFLARRVSRIYPAFAAAVLLLFVFGLVAQVPSVPEANFHETPPGLVDVALNLVFLGELGEWVNGSFWSIAVEIKFYLLVALLWALVPNSARFTRVFAILALVMAPIWMASTLLSDAGSGPITPQSMLKFLAIAPYLTFFAVGIVGRQQQAGDKSSGWLMLANVAMSTAVVAVEEYSSSAEPSWLGVATVALVYLAMAGLFLRFVSGKALPTVPLLSHGLAQLGFLSFSWYLIHETIGVTFLATFNRLLPAWMSLGVVVVGTLCIAVVFANLFEWRFRKPVERLAMAVLDWLGRSVRGLGALRTEADTKAAE